MFKQAKKTTKIYQHHRAGATEGHWGPDTQIQIVYSRADMRHESRQDEIMGLVGRRSHVSLSMGSLEVPWVITLCSACNTALPLSSTRYKA